jgi:AcrR family transcriptional regulator
LRAAHVSQQTLYELFAGVGDLLVCGCAQEFDLLLESVEQVVAEQQRWEDGVREGLRLLLERLGSRPELARCLFLQLCGVQPAGERYRLEALRRLASALAPDRSTRGPEREMTLAEQLVAGGVWHAIQDEVVCDRIAGLPSLSPVLSAHVLRFGTRWPHRPSVADASQQARRTSVRQADAR